jgi:hypothetical protein
MADPNQVIPTLAPAKVADLTGLKPFLQSPTQYNRSCIYIINPY